MDTQELKKLAEAKAPENKKFFGRLRNHRPARLDGLVHGLHAEVFERTDCLTCANCCKTTSPLFRQKDVERLASHFKIKAGDFIARYLHTDEDGDLVLNAAPCPFLGPDNYCSVYESRPNACREYPHTDQRKIHTILKETYNNIAVCPAVFEIIEKLKQVL
jgi:Fe-S-cluster containining protein